MSKTQRIRAHYEPRIIPGRANFDILDWASRESQVIRFDVLAANVDLAGKSLLDVGCGLGDLWAFLKARDIPMAYTGVDLAEKMAAAARDRHTDADFQCGDVFAGGMFEPGSFDVVFGSGVFNLDLGNNAEFLPGAIARLLELAGECLVFNLLHKRAAGGGPYFYFDPKQVRPMLAALPCRTRIISDYLPNDFTVVCRKRQVVGHRS